MWLFYFLSERQQRFGAVQVESIFKYCTLTLRRSRTVRSDGEVDDKGSDADPGHDHEKIKSAAFLACSSFGADTDCSPSPFPFFAGAEKMHQAVPPSIYL